MRGSEYGPPSGNVSLQIQYKKKEGVIEGTLSQTKPHLLFEITDF